MARIDGIAPEGADPKIAPVLAAQRERWGAPLANHLVYARRPTIFRGVRAMWSGLDASGLVAPELIALVNRRIALVNRCEF